MLRVLRSMIKQNYLQHLAAPAKYVLRIMMLGTCTSKHTPRALGVSSGTRMFATRFPTRVSKYWLFLSLPVQLRRKQKKEADGGWSHELPKRRYCECIHVLCVTTALLLIRLAPYQALAVRFATGCVMESRGLWPATECQRVRDPNDLTKWEKRSRKY